MRSATVAKAAAAIVVVAVSFGASLMLMDWLSPREAVRAPVLTALPPLPAAPGKSTVLAQIAIPLGTIRDAADRATPRNFSGKIDNPAPQILENANIGWTASRGAMTASGAQDALTLTTPLSGTMNMTGSLSSKTTGALGNALGSLLGGNVAKQIGSVNIKSINANGEIKGNVAISARPKLLPAWRIDPGLTAQSSLGDSSLSVAGVKVNVPAQVKPLIDKTIADQLATVQARIRNDSALERSARTQWSKACRSIPLQGISAPSSIPQLWLELRPVRAVATQPRLDSSALSFTLGIEAETRITPAQTTPDCPFPAVITVIPQGNAPVRIAVPIDLPLRDVGNIINAQLAGRSFPEGGSNPVSMTVKRATVAASGDRLLVSILASSNEKQGWFGFGGDTTIHVWARPVLDQSQQTLRFTDIDLAVESEAAFGLLGTAARAAMPQLQRVLADKATVDLKPFASNAQRKIAAAITDFQRNDDGMRVAAEITGLRLSGIAFDSTTLRVIAQAEGTINVAITALPGL